MFKMSFKVLFKCIYVKPDEKSEYINEDDIKPEKIELSD